ncbi:hypothetical protein ACLOJK_031517 [Asimina triloba]
MLVRLAIFDEEAPSADAVAEDSGDQSRAEQRRLLGRERALDEDMFLPLVLINQRLVVGGPHLIRPLVEPSQPPPAGRPTVPKANSD